MIGNWLLKTSRISKGIMLGLTILVLTAYWPLQHNDFINEYDDSQYILDNPFIQNGLTWESVRWAFTSFYAANWHPLTWISHMVDIELYGLNAGGHHLTNLALHIAATLALFVLLKVATGSIWASAFVASLFSVHPLHVESVAWAAERKDVLSAFLGLVSVNLYVAYARKGALSRYILCLCAFALGLMAKPMLVSIPVVMLLLDYWPLNRLPSVSSKGAFLGYRRLLLEKISFGVLTAGSCVVTFLAQKAGGAVASIESFSLWTRASNAAVAYTRYLWKLFVPTNLSVFYPHRGVPPLPIVVLAFTLLFGVTGLVLWMRKSQPWVVTGWFWFLVTLVPVSGIVQVGAQAYADRYAYIPFIGLYLGLSFSFGKGIGDRSGFRTPAVIGAITVLIAFLAVTRERVTDWQNSFSLFSQAIEATEANYVAHSNLGVALARLDSSDEAEKHLRHALRIHRKYARAYCGLGVLYMKNRELPDSAITYFKAALEIDPSFANAHFNYAIALAQVGDTGAAIKHYEQAARDPGLKGGALSNLGILVAQRKDYSSAVEYFAKAITHEPGNPRPYMNRAKAWEEWGELDSAIAEYNRLGVLYPGDPLPYIRIGDLRVTQNELDLALHAYRTALHIAPGSEHTSRVSDKIRRLQSEKHQD